MSRSLLIFSNENNIAKLVGEIVSTDCVSYLEAATRGVLRNFAKFTRNWCFPVNFPKFPKTPFSQNISGRLLLVTVKLNPNEYDFQKQPFTNA